MLNYTIQIVVALVSVFFVGNSFACSCVGGNLDETFKKSSTVVVAIPMEANVVGVDQSPPGSIHAKLTVLDTLKGTKPNPALTMVSSVKPDSGMCQSPIYLGVAYVLFLQDQDQEFVHATECSANAAFEYLRNFQEEVCYEGHPWSDRCSPNLLNSLRSADTSNEMYNFDSSWKKKHEVFTKRRIKEILDDQARHERELIELGQPSNEPNLLLRRPL